MTTEILISIIGIIIIILLIPDDGITSEMKKEFELFTEKERGQIHVDNTGSSVEMRDLTLPELAESRINENNSRINHIKNEIWELNKYKIYPKYRSTDPNSYDGQIDMSIADFKNRIKKLNASSDEMRAKIEYYNLRGWDRIFHKY